MPMSRLTLPEHRERFRWLHEPPPRQLAEALGLAPTPDSGDRTIALRAGSASETTGAADPQGAADA